MAISRTQGTVDKLNALVGKKFTPSTIEFAVTHWENEEFPRKLETQVRRWMQENSNKDRFAAVITRYAKLDEQSAKWLVDPLPAAQDVILKLNDEDDRALLLKRCSTFTEISARLWRVIAASDLSVRIMSKLAEREDAPRVFVKEYGAEEKPARQPRAEKLIRGHRGAPDERPARPRRTSAAAKEEEKPVRGRRKVVTEEVSRRGRTGRAEKVVKPKIKDVSDDLDFEDDNKPIRQARASRTIGKTVKKPGKLPSAIQKVRAVVGPERQVVRSTSASKVRVEKPLNSGKARDSARQVRRPRP